MSRERALGGTNYCDSLVCTISTRVTWRDTSTNSNNTLEAIPLKTRKSFVLSYKSIVIKNSVQIHRTIHTQRLSYGST